MPPISTQTQTQTYPQPPNNPPYGGGPGNDFRFVDDSGYLDFAKYVAKQRFDVTNAQVVAEGEGSSTPPNRGELNTEVYLSEISANVATQQGTAVLTNSTVIATQVMNGILAKNPAITRFQGADGQWHGSDGSSGSPGSGIS